MKVDRDMGEEWQFPWNSRLLSATWLSPEDSTKKIDNRMEAYLYCSASTSLIKVGGEREGKWRSLGENGSPMG